VDDECIYLRLLRGLGFAFGFDPAAAFLEVFAAAFGTGVVDFVFSAGFGCVRGGSTAGVAGFGGIASLENRGSKSSRVFPPPAG